MQSFELVTPSSRRTPTPTPSNPPRPTPERQPVPVLPLSGRNADTLAQSCFAIQISIGAPCEKRSVADSAADIVDTSTGDRVSAETRAASQVSVRIFGAGPRKIRDGEACNPAAQAMSRITALDDRIRTWLKTKCVAYPLADAVYLVPRPILSEVDDRLDQYEDERKQAIGELARVYLWGCDQAKVDLGPLHRAEWYPSTAEQFCARYYVTRGFIPLWVPDDRLKEEAGDLYQREQERCRERISRAADEIVLGMRASLLTLTQELQDALTRKDEAGRPKSFKSTTLEKVREWIETFRYRNVTGDQELARVVEQAREALKGVDASAIKSSNATRAAVVATMATVTSTLASLASAKPTRRIRFDVDAAD